MAQTKRGLGIIALLLAVILALPAAFMATAYAAGEECRVRVHSGTEEAARLLESAGAVADLYLIAGSEQPGAYDYPEGFDPDLNQEKWRGIAEKEALARAGAQEPDVSGLKLGEWTGVNSDGTALEPGLYLVIVRPADDTDYLKTFLDEGNNEYLASEILSEGCSVRVMPEIVAVPGKDNPNGTANSADSTPWDYNVDISVKPEIEKMLGAFEIVKDLITHEMDHEALFLFQCEGYLDGEHVYSNLVSMRFDKACEQRILIENIPVGTEMTVTEAYSTPGYELTGMDPEDGKIVISADDILEVRFENDYEGTRTKGGGIMNHFAYDLERGEWSWEQE